MSEAINTQYLEGLTFLSAEREQTEEGARNIPTERELTPEDVLAWADRGDSVVIVAKDGRKHEVFKEGCKPADSPQSTTEKGKNKGVLARDIQGGGNKK